MSRILLWRAEWRLDLVLVLAVSMLLNAPKAAADQLPLEVGQCSETRIVDLGSRLRGVPGSGSAVQYDNGSYQVSDDVLPELLESHIGDRVRLCLLSIPPDCPVGDERGRMYEGTNLRTGRSWEAPASQRSCDGA
jgi:hypothetical protein